LKQQLKCSRFVFGDARFDVYFGQRLSCLRGVVIFFNPVRANSWILLHTYTSFSFIFNKTNKTTNLPNFILPKKLYMFRAFPLPIIRSFLLYIRHWHISCRFDDSFQRVILTLLGSCHQPARNMPMSNVQ